jgi:hypothetical protein
LTREVVVAVPQAAAKARYALGVLLDLLGLPWREARPGERPVLAYGPNEEASCSIAAGPAAGWDDPAPLVTRIGEVPLLHLPGAPVTPSPNAAELRLDVLYATYACLTAPWERVDPADEVGCPVAAEGWLARNHLLAEPLVHRYAVLLERALRVAGFEPSARTPVVVLTHDVDNNFGHLFGVRERLELLRRDLRARDPAALRRLAGVARQAVRRGPDPADRFDEWAELHARRASRPTYFVASFGLFRPGAAREDVPYDVRHHEVRRVLRQVLADGAEIGVHLSLGAHESPERVRLEREALEEAVGSPVRSARHHWWALGRDPERTLARHAAAGLVLDCSLGFNDRSGFRRGIAAPFRPFDRETAAAGAIWELPTIAMDAAVVTGRDVEAAAEELRSLHETVVGVAGALVLDWHAHALDPVAFPRAGEVLRRFLNDALVEGTPLVTATECVRKLTAGSALAV